MGRQRNLSGAVFLFFLFVLGSSNISFGFESGFNQAWFGNRFATQWTIGFDEKEIRHVLDLTQKSKSKILRVWLFEGNASTSLLWNSQGKAIGLNPIFEKNFRIFVNLAAEFQVKVYVTVLSHTLKFEPYEEIYRPYWSHVFNNQHGYQEDFFERILKPLMTILSSPEVEPHLYGIDLVNEIDSYVMKKFILDDWYGANRFICSARSVVQKYSKIPVTASIGWPAIPFRHRGALQILFDPNPHPSCVDFWDIHLYNNYGMVPRCAELKNLSKKYQKPLVLGEFGQLQLHTQFDDELQSNVTKNFLKGAYECGFSAALAWRLIDVRDGHNPDARYSYYAFNKTRPAYREFSLFHEWLASQNSK